MLKQNRPSVYYSVAFFIAFLTLSFLYGYFDMINQPADGVHVWRQSDGLSMALKFYEDGNSLFEPKMHNQLNDEGMAAGEFPILYYIVGKLYHIFGVNIWVFRSVWWLISFLGYFFLFQFCSKILNNKLWGILISLFTFTSPILIIYGFSFVPDPTALSLTFISWYTLYSFYISKKKKFLLLSILLICIAATIKITSLISIFALCLVLGVNLLIRRIRWQINTQQTILSLAPIAIGLLIISSWYYYTSHYNKVHNTAYFFLKTAPIWDITAEQRVVIYNQILGWSREYFYETGRHVIYVFAILIIFPIFNKSFCRKEYWLYLLSFLGVIAFSLLFYSQFSHHDYYIINLVFIVPLTVLAFVRKYQFLLSKKKWITPGFQLLFSVLLVASTIHAKKRSNERFAVRDLWLNLNLYELRDKLPEYGVLKEDLVVVPHDPSPNITLYALNRNGWTGLNSVQSPEILNLKIEQGAKWMIIPDKNFYDHPVVEPYKENLVVDFKGIRIYSIQPSKQN